MTRCAHLFVLATTLTVGAVCAQKPLPKPAFHLPAGEYSLRELLDLTEQATHAPIARSTDFEDAENGRIRLQTGLALDAAAWRRTLETLLHRHGFVLAFDPEEQRGEVVAERTCDADWIRERAQEVALAELFAGGRHGPVRVTVPTTFGAADAQAFIAPVFVGSSQQVAFAGEAGAITVTGLAEVVRSAVTMVANMDPTLAGKVGAPAAAWPREVGERRLEIAKGRYTARELIDLLARQMQWNVLAGEVAEQSLEKPIEVAETRVLDMLAFEAAITRHLWNAGLLVVALPACRDLHEVIATNGCWGQTVATLATPLAAAEVVAREELVAWATVTWMPQHTALEAAQECLRNRMRQPAGPARDRSMTVLSLPSGLVFKGLTMDLQASLAALIAADVPGPAAVPATGGS